MDERILPELKTTSREPTTWPFRAIPPLKSPAKPDSTLRRAILRKGWSLSVQGV